MPRRLLANAVDATVALGLGLLLSSTLGLYFSSRAVVALEMDSPESVWKGPVPLVLGVFGKLVYLMPFVIFLVLALEAVVDRGPGKALLGLRVSPAGAGGRERAPVLGRAVVRAGPWGVVAAGLVLGRWEPMALGAAGSLLLLLCFAPVLAGRRSVYDRALGLDVTRTG